MPSGSRLVQSGSVIQVQSTFKNDIFTTTSTSFVDITGMSVTITPTSNTSKILVLVNIATESNSSNSNLYNLVRNGTAIAQPATGASAATMNNYVTSYAYSTSINYLDSPASAVAVTYKLQGRVDGGTLYFNRHSGSADFTGTSSITVMEIGG